MESNFIKILGSISPYCKGDSNCPGYLIDDGNRKILLDCGPGISGKMDMPKDLENLTIVISHFHKDHYTDLFSLGYASLCYNRMGMLNQRIKVYIPEMLPEEKGYEDYLLIMNNKDHFFDIQSYKKDSKICLDDTSISFFENHHSIKSFSTKIESLESSIVYTGDMGYKNIDNFVSFCQDVDILISEATYLDTDNVVDENHLHAKEAGMIASRANVKSLILTHFWPEHNRYEYVHEASQIFSNVVAADENIIFNISELCNGKESFHR